LRAQVFSGGTRLTYAKGQKIFDSLFSAGWQA